MDKANVDKILFNNPLPSMFNDWFTFVSAQHIYQIPSTAEGKLSKLFKTISYGKTCCIQCYNVQQKLGSLKNSFSCKN